MKNLRGSKMAKDKIDWQMVAEQMHDRVVELENRVEIYKETIKELLSE